MPPSFLLLMVLPRIRSTPHTLSGGRESCAGSNWVSVWEDMGRPLTVSILGVLCGWSEAAGGVPVFKCNKICLKSPLTSNNLFWTTQSMTPPLYAQELGYFGEYCWDVEPYNPPKLASKILLPRSPLPSRIVTGVDYYEFYNWEWLVRFQELSFIITSWGRFWNKRNLKHRRLSGSKSPSEKSSLVWPSTSCQKHRPC